MDLPEKLTTTQYEALATNTYIGADGESYQFSVKHKFIVVTTPSAYVNKLIGSRVIDDGGPWCSFDIVSPTNPRIGYKFILKELVAHVMILAGYTVFNEHVEYQHLDEMFFERIERGIDLSVSRFSIDIQYDIRRKTAIYNFADIDISIHYYRKYHLIKEITVVRKNNHPLIKHKKSDLHLSLGVFVYYEDESYIHDYAQIVRDAFSRFEWVNQSLHYEGAVCETDDIFIEAKKAIHKIMVSSHKRSIELCS